MFLLVFILKRSKKIKDDLNIKALKLLDEREKYSEKTISELYDPLKMPNNLLNIHIEIDQIIEKCYKNTPFKDDNERIEFLFKNYEKMSSENNLL